MRSYNELDFREHCNQFWKYFFLQFTVQMKFDFINHDNSGNFIQQDTPLPSLQVKLSPLSFR